MGRTAMRAREPSQRMLQVGEEIRRALAMVLARGDARDPALASMDLTVTEVRTSPDLRHATAFVIPLGGGGDSLGGTSREEAMAALRHAAPHLRRRVAVAVKLKYAPALSFQYDASFDEAGRIDTLLRHPAVARDIAAAETPHAEQEAR